MLTGMQVCLHGIDNTLAVDETDLVFLYKADSVQEENEVKSYHFILRDEKRQVVWDTGWCEAGTQPFVSYDGKDLLPKTRYFLDASFSDAYDDVLEQENIFSFETGFRGSPWQAKWIEPAQEEPTLEKRVKFWDLFEPIEENRSVEQRLKCAHEIRMEFTCKKDIQKARIYSSAHGIYDFSVNGRMEQNCCFAPEISSYNDRLYYQTYDLTELLLDGTNVLEFTVADGWWIGRIGLTGDSCQYGDRLGILAQVEITYRDGSQQIEVSSSSAKSRESYVRYSDLFMGEKQDLTAETRMLRQKSIEHYSWNSCTEADYDMQNLVSQPMNPVVITEEICDYTVIQTGDRELLIDFGQNFAGIAELVIETNTEMPVVLEYSEILDENGNFLKNIQGRNKEHTDVFLVDPGRHCLHPRFTYHGFRYVRITAPKTVRICSAKGIVLGSKLTKTGDFHCSDDRLNQLQSNIVWSERSNMFSIPTDCPQREKMGWTGDIQIFAKTGCFNYDLYAFLKSWMENMALEQAKDGEIPNVVPNFPMYDLLQREDGGSNSSPGWGDAALTIPYTLYFYTGDEAILRRFYPIMEKWIAYMQKQAEQKPENYASFSEAQKERNPYLYTKGFQYGDWLIPSLSEHNENPMIGADETKPVVGSCLYVLNVQLMMEISEILGYKEKSNVYRELLGKIKNAVREEFLDENGDVHAVPYQGVYVMLLAADIPNERQRSRVVELLSEMIRKNGNRLDAGFIAIKYLMDVLCDNDCKELAYRLLYQTEAPSWLYEVEQGATTIWENWFAVGRTGVPLPASFNHYAYGCVGDWMYRRIGGIHCLEPGYKKILFAPDLDTAINSSNCSIDTVRGSVSCIWEKTEESVKIKVSVPCASTAELKVYGNEISLGSGIYSFEFGNENGQ